MKNKVIVSCLLLSVVLFDASLASSQTKLKALYERKQFFELRDALKEIGSTGEGEDLFYRAVVSNKFHRPIESIELIQRFLATATEQNTLIRDSYEVLADNYVKTYQYQKAAEAYKTILTRFGPTLTVKKKRDIQNSARLWSALSSVPAQSITRHGSSTIQTKHNDLGLTEWPVEVNGEMHNFIFDTGANLSTVIRSYAVKLGFKIIDTSIKVGSITDTQTIARLAVAPAIKIGEVTINNAIFLVFEDKDFYVAPARFQINAIVGFPIIEALKEISFRKNGEVFLPANPGAGGEQNMFLDGLTPGIAGVFRGRRLTFTFDSGADNTLFYPRFYRANETEIKRKYKAQPRRLGGAGGVTPVIAYRVTDLVISFSGKDARFTAADILTRGVNEEARYYDGNLGQDLIKQFEKMTINFNAMSIVFE
jgi:predicted aspartyl protease